jgi:hypothetical protein
MGANDKANHNVKRDPKQNDFSGGHLTLPANPSHILLFFVIWFACLH